MLSNYLTSVIRTLVPAAWGTALAWLVSVGVLDQAAANGPGAAAGGFLVTVCIGGYYIVARFLESQPWFPAWLSALLFGAPSAPAYASTARADGDPLGGQHRVG